MYNILYTKKGSLLRATVKDKNGKNLTFFLLVLALLGACSPLQPKEGLREGELIARENWRMCALAYKKAGRYTVHNYHRSGTSVPKYYQIKEDLVINNCRRVLGPYWID